MPNIDLKGGRKKMAMAGAMKAKVEKEEDASRLATKAKEDG